MAISPDLQTRILKHLNDTGNADAPFALVVLAAMDGPPHLSAFLEGASAIALPDPPAAGATAPAAEPPGVYVSSITVEGLRGVGCAATLDLHPGPGLTLVVGRNGSGKSSFAEGLELLLTGRNARWDGRAKNWEAGWRNLHHNESVAVRATLVVERQGSLTAARVWEGDDPDCSTATIKQQGAPAQPLASLGWANALVSFRPFLSYNELGSLLEDGPSKLYDRLAGVLGLDELVEVQTVVTTARKERANLIDDARTQARTLADRLSASAPSSSDDRLATARAVLSASKWDLAALQALVADSTSGGSPETDHLRRLAALQVPDLDAVSAVVSRLRAAAGARAALAGTNAERSRERASLLDEALRFVARQPTADCPVCGTMGVLSAAWSDTATREVQRLRAEASGCDAAEQECAAALRQARECLTSAPAVLGADVSIDLPALAAARTAWTAWAAGRDLADPVALADHLESRVLDLADAVASLVEQARQESQRREDLWRPFALQLAAWLQQARRAERASAQLPDLKRAEQWMKDAVDAIRTERFRPIRDRALEVWRQLRLQSHVNLDDVALGGASTRRRVDLQVTVDGTDASALGVMSQGELHSLALSLFLPRVTLPESPFRFISIDDPVQSMDPARVEGLARVLADTARTRQVIVFTHDDRLPEATRRLGIPARVLLVTRRAQSHVDVRVIGDPIDAYFDDARAVTKTEGLPGAVARRVVPGFCRAAIEAACMDAVRRRRLGRGERHDDVEVLLSEHATPMPLMALALYDDWGRAGDVLARLSRERRAYADVFQACRQGAHEEFEGDVGDLVNEAQRLAAFVRELK